MVPELAVAPERVETPEGHTLVWRVSSGLLFTRAEGRMVMANAESIMKAVDAVAGARPGAAIAVHDWTGIESYEIAVQARMSVWSIGVSRHMLRIVVGVVSPFVAAAVRTANLAVGQRIEVVKTREQVVAVAREELSRARQEHATAGRY